MGDSSSAIFGKEALVTFRMQTSRGRCCHEVISAIQKFVRRGMEREAMLLALEMHNTNKGCFTWACNRLRVIAHEDIGLANPIGVLFAIQSLDQAERFYGKGECKLMLGNAILALCRGPKSRECDHFVCALNHQIDHEPPLPIPDYALDKHTYRGKRMGRGMQHFLDEGAKLVPEPEPGADRYADEARAALLSPQPQPAQPDTDGASADEASADEANTDELTEWGADPGRGSPSAGKRPTKTHITRPPRELF